MQSKGVAVMPKSSATPSNEAIIIKWLRVIAELCGREVTPLLAASWCELLSDIEPALLENALRETAKTCGRFFPTPGEVRERIAKADHGALELQASQQWERALKVAESDGRGYQSLSPATQQAIRAAGGLTWIESCPRSELQWARTKFIQTYLLIHDSGQHEHLLSDGDAKNLVRELASCMPKALHE